MKSFALYFSISFAVFLGFTMSNGELSFSNFLLVSVVSILLGGMMFLRFDIAPKISRRIWKSKEGDKEK